LAGCRQQSEEEVPSRAKILSIMASQFRMQHRGELPKDESELRAYLDSQAEVLAQYGVDSASDLLLSETDGQPLVLLFGRSILYTPDGRQVIAHEQGGIDGLRTVVFAVGETEDLDEASFKALRKR
jgi:hypothetical protein